MSQPLLKPDGTLLLRPVLLWFAAEQDEAAFRHASAARRLHPTQVVAGLLALLAILSMAASGEDLSDTNTMLVLIICRVVPAVGLFVAACLGATSHWLWSAGAAACCGLLPLSAAIIANLCDGRDGAASSTTCGPVVDGFPSFLPFALLWVSPFIMSSGLGVRWLETAVASSIGYAVSLGIVLSSAGAEHVLQPLLTSLVALAVGLASTYANEVEARLSFKATAAADRRLESLVEEAVSSMVYNESQQRLNELVKLMPAMVSELDPQGVVKFVSPASRALLGIAPTDMLAADSLQFVHPDDQRKAKNALKRALAAALSTDGSAGVPNARQAYARVLLRRRRANPNGTSSWVNMEMHVFVVDRPGQDPALVTVERLATFAEVAAAAATARGEDGVHSTAPQEGAVGTATFDPEHERNLGFALAYACMAERILPTASDPSTSPLFHERVREGQSMLADVVGGMTAALRCKAHNLPVTAVGDVNILHMVDVCVSIAKVLVGSIVLEVHSDSSVPAAVSCDGPKARAALMSLLMGAFGRSGPSQLGTVAVVLVRSVVPQPGAPPSIIRLELQVKGAEGSKASITARQLSADLQLDPLADVMAPPERVGSDTAQNEALLPTNRLHKYTLGASRHLALSLGGNLGVSPGAPALSDPSGVTFWLHIPVTTQPRTFTAGPTAVPLPILRQRIVSTAMPRLTKDPFAPHNVPVRLTSAAGGAASPGAGAASPGTPSSPTTPAPAPAPAPAPRPAPGRTLPANIQNLGKHIMFVDDEHVNRRLGSRMLQRLGCTFDLLEDGDEVSGRLSNTDKPFDMIIIDIVMQRTDGAVVCAQLRNAGVDLPIIAMTGNTGARDVKRFLTAGFDMMLAKPFDITGLGRAILEAPARRARTRARAAQQRGTAQAAAAAAAAAAGVEISDAS